MSRQLDVESNWTPHLLVGVQLEFDARSAVPLSSNGSCGAVGYGGERDGTVGAARRGAGRDIP